MSMHFANFAERAQADGVVTADEITELRRLCWSDNHISQAEAESLFAANNALSKHTPEWTDFFVEALNEFIVNQLEPRGYVSDANAQWLMTQIDHDGKFGSMAECELLVRVFETALNVPEPLKLFAAERIEQAVVTGEGPTRDGGALEAGNVSAAEAKILRRFLFAPAGERLAAVGPREAELLFRLKDATLQADNDPEWKRLFVQGVANFLMGYSSVNSQIGRDRAVELNAAMDDNTPSLRGFIGKAALSAPDLAGGWRYFSGAISNAPDRERSETRAAGVAESHAITDAESEWLESRIAADNQIDEYEQALLEFLAEDAE